MSARTQSFVGTLDPTRSRPTPTRQLPSIPSIQFNPYLNIFGFGKAVNHLIHCTHSLTHRNTITTSLTNAHQPSALLTPVRPSVGSILSHQTRSIFPHLVPSLRGLTWDISGSFLPAY